MANSFSKEERVAFEQIIEGFHDQLVLSNTITVFRPESVMMERTSNIIWRSQPYVARSYSGTDMTANFNNSTQLSVPVTIGFNRSSPWTMTSFELRDALQEGRLGEAAGQKLASDINVAVNNVAAYQGTLVVKRTVAATGFDDLAQAEALMNEQGIQTSNRFAAFSTRDYNGMASDLAKRQTMQGKPETAYEKALVGQGIANFDVLKMDYTPRLPAAAGVGVTINGAQFYVPTATSTASTGEVSNVDNRYMNLSITVTSGTVAVGDCFTIGTANTSNAVNAIHHITKGDTGQLKTFRITAIITGAGGTGVIQVSPPIIAGSNGGGSNAEIAYQNVTQKALASAAVTFLNTQSAFANPFWHKDALELIPGHDATPTDAGTSVLRSTTEQGIELVWQKWYDIKTKVILYRLDTFFGVANKQPEMSGIELFSQT